MKFYIRFTDTPKADLIRKRSYHLSDVEAEGYEWNEYFNAFAEDLGGLCAYELYADSIEGAIEEALEFKQGIFDAKSNFDSYCVLSGQFIDTCPEGVIINPKDIFYIKKGNYFEE